MKGPRRILELRVPWRAHAAVWSYGAQEGPMPQYNQHLLAPEQILTVHIYFHNLQLVWNDIISASTNFHTTCTYLSLVIILISNIGVVVHVFVQMFILAIASNLIFFIINNERCAHLVFHIHCWYFLEYLSFACKKRLIKVQFII